MRARRHALRPLCIAVQIFLAGIVLPHSLGLDPAHAQTAATARDELRDYDIPAGPLTTVLNLYAQQAGVYLAGTGELARGRASATRTSPRTI